MRVDSNTNGHRQWFYFSMRNEKKCRLKLNIYRFKKHYSLFQRGMKPYAKSRKEGKDWKPAGEGVTYRHQRQRNQYGVKKDVKTYVLTFYYTFQFQNDEVYIASGIPYSYTFLYKQLNFYKEQMNKNENITFDISTICKSMCGVDIPLLTIQHKLARLVEEKKKQFIIINARTHSGQSSSSWVLDGILLQMVQSKDLENWLLSQNICFKIIPMLNPDGVLIGNYRTGIIGEDLNRRFHSGKKQFYPEINSLKKLLSQCKKQGTVQLFLDLHGHSILKNSFIYGPSETDSSKFKMRLLPTYLQHHSSKYFRLASCKFKTEKDTVQTARGYFQMKEDVLSFTCENSLGLYYHQNQTFQMLAGDWQIFGQALLNSIIAILQKADVSADIKHSKIAIELNNSYEGQKRMSYGVKIPLQYPKSNKNQKLINNRALSTNKHVNYVQKFDVVENKVCFSEQIHREDEIIDTKQFSFNQKSGKQEKQTSKSRGKSQAVKNPASRLVQSIINKNKLLQLERKYSGQQKMIMFLGRSSTHDTTQNLKKDMQTLIKYEQAQQVGEMEIINQNFSDEYISINDSDSSSENLPEQEKNYLFEYIKSNKHKLQSNQEEDDKISSQKQEKLVKIKENKESKIGAFREIRFKSIEQVYTSDVNIKEGGRSYAKKLKLEPHKFKDSTTKAIVYKNESINSNQFDDPTIVAFSQQKRLNERNQQRKTHKDPFILYQRKEKLDRLLERE